MVPPEGFDAGRLVVNPNSVAGAQLDESSRCEISIEGECLRDAITTHYGKARRIDERVLAFVVSSQPIQCLRFSGLVHVNDDHTVGTIDCIKK
jgi:hypothetical protein